MKAKIILIAKSQTHKTQSRWICEIPLSSSALFNIELVAYPTKKCFGGRLCHDQTKFYSPLSNAKTVRSQMRLDGL